MVAESVELIFYLHHHAKSFLRLIPIIHVFSYYFYELRR